MNEYGLDAPYFKGNLEQILAGIDRYPPGEMMRSLQRLAEVASTQADAADLARATWVELPKGTNGNCPPGAGAKRIAVRRRNGEVNVWRCANPGPDWMHGCGSPELDIMAWTLLGEPR